MAVMSDSAARALERRLAAIVARPGEELPGLALVLVEEGRVTREVYLGRRVIDPAAPERERPVDRVTRFRVASVSKPFVAAAAMALAERGLLDLEADLSPLLGFPLRNPRWPDRPISAAMLLSHTSSIRDLESYNLPLGHGLRELLEPGGPYWPGEGRYAAPEPDSDRSPGAYYAYCNLGYGILATAMEKATGERFDRLVRRLVLEPLGIRAGFNVNELDDEAFAALAPAWRKSPDGETWDPEGPWIPQVDDYRGRRPALPCRAEPGLGPADLEAYLPGTNGTIFSPQGGLRASPLELAAFIRMLIGGGTLDGRRILSADSLRLMTSPRWTWDPARRNGEVYLGLTRQTGLGLMRVTDTFDAEGGDRLAAAGGPRPWGHHGDAYGILAGMLCEPDRGFGFAYVIGGLSVDPERRRGSHSSFFVWEEEIHAAVLEESGRVPRG